MRVSMIDPSLFTWPYDQELARGLADCGHDVTLFGRRPGPDDGARLAEIRLVEAFYQIAGSRAVAGLPGGLRLAVKGVDHLWSMGRLLRRLAREAPDVIHFQWLPLPLVDRRLLAGFRRVAPLVLTVHDTNPFNGDPSSRLQARGFFACLDRFERLIVHTEQGYARLRSRGVPAGRLDIVPHGRLIAPLPFRKGDAMAGVMTFVLFGKIKPYKGADLLIEAFARLPQRLRAQARLRIVGKPYMDLAPLRALAAARGLRLGEGAGEVGIEPRFVPDAEIPELFGPGVVAAFPYREIDASGVLFQALSQGRPMIASRLGSFAELLTDGLQGHLCAPEDVPALTAAMVHLVEDRGFAAACSRAAVALSAQTPSWLAIAQRTGAIYEAAIAVPAVRRRATEVSSSTRKITGGNC